MNSIYQKDVSQMRHRFVLCLVMVFPLVMGCGGGPEKPPEYTVKGTVAVDGKPLESGSIVFEAADGKTAASGGGIQNGAFEFKSPVGKKKVKITANQETGKKDEYGEPITESLIPEKYNTKTTLEFEVQPNDENTKDWNLDKQ